MAYVLLVYEYLFQRGMRIWSKKKNHIVGLGLGVGVAH